MIVVLLVWRKGKQLVCCFWLFHNIMPYIMIILYFRVYLIFMSHTVLYFLQSTSVLSIVIDLVLTLSNLPSPSSSPPPPTPPPSPSSSSTAAAAATFTEPLKIPHAIWSVGHFSWHEIPECYDQRLTKPLIIKCLAAPCYRVICMRKVTASNFDFCQCFVSGLRMVATTLEWTILFQLTVI